MNENREILQAMIDENKSILKMAEKHMDERACVVLRQRIFELEKQIEKLAPSTPTNVGIDFEKLEILAWQVEKGQISADVLIEWVKKMTTKDSANVGGYTREQPPPLLRLRSW